ncbi:MAG: carboxypeptidase-like regulatory domain-containing protein [Bacteroidota bacterium]
MKITTIILGLLLGLPCIAQTGTIKGTILDKQSENPLEGATIELLDAQTATGVVTDFDGRFVLEEVSVGRRAIRVSYIGYESTTIPNIVVTTGKDVSLNIGLLESCNKID